MGISRKNIKFITRGVLILILFFLGYKIYEGFIDTKKALDEDLPSSFNLLKRDSDLISKKFIDKVRVIEVRRSKVRGPISFLLYDSKYFLFLYEMSLSKDKSFKNIFHIENRNSDRSVGVVYSIIDNGLYFRFENKSYMSEAISEIFLTLKGDSLQTIANEDTIVSYHLLCTNLSIKYSKNDPVDIFLEGKEKSFGSYNIPLDVLFLKHKGCVYFVFMISADTERPIPPKLLYQVVTGNDSDSLHNFMNTN